MTKEPAAPDLWHRTGSTYSSFAPVALVLSVLIVLTLVDLYSAFQGRAELQVALRQSQAELQKNEWSSRTLSRLSHDLLLLSEKSPEARKIVSEFGIQAGVQTVPVRRTAGAK